MIFAEAGGASTQMAAIFSLAYQMSHNSKKPSGRASLDFRQRLLTVRFTFTYGPAGGPRLLGRGPLSLFLPFRFLDVFFFRSEKLSVLIIVIADAKKVVKGTFPKRPATAPW